MRLSKQIIKEFNKARSEYIKAKAVHEATEQIEKECKQKVLQENEFLTEDSQERITDYKSDFRMNDEASERYFKLVYEEETKRGLNIPDYNTAATYKTFPALKKAEDDLLNIGIYTIPETERESIKKTFNHWKYRYEVLNLMVKLDI